MTRSNTAAPRWVWLSLAVAAVCLISERPSLAVSDEADTPVAERPTPVATVTGLPPELDDLSREQLIDLVKDLTLQNQVLAVSLAELREQLANASPELQQRIEYQARTIDRLQAKLARSEAAAAELTATLENMPPQVVDSADTPEVEGTDADPDANPEWEYRFAYEFGLIRTSGDGHVVLRDENGKRQRHEFDYTEYRRDALWVNLLIRNDSKQPMRFAGLIELRGDKPFLGKDRERLATHAFRTPLLEPGEVFQINEDELTVERPWKVDVVELTHVKAFSTPADPDPDPTPGSG